MSANSIRIEDAELCLPIWTEDNEVNNKMHLKCTERNKYHNKV